MQPNQPLTKNYTALTFLVSFILICFSSFQLKAQQIQFSSKAITLEELFSAVENQASINFVFSEDEINKLLEVKLNSNVYELDELINKTKTQLNLNFERIDNYYVVTQSKPDKEILYQTLRGVVLDLETGSSLPSANIYIAENLDKSTITDLDGNFVIEAPLGRLNLAISYVGYKTVVIPMLINSGQEQFLTIELEPSVSNLQEVVIEAERDKARTQNELAYASGRGFTVLEANKYAGTLGDPARMARSFAGVLPARDDRNDIIIRGNSPTGIQWRIDDIEVPNPNHYGGIGLTGNTTTLLNMNLLDNSDFLMGAFPSQYGNALSGVFDLHTKKINPTKRQYRFQTGWNGFELGAEGPFSKKNPFGTYSLTYRYSFLDVVDLIGVDLGVLPKFQDLTAKLDFKVGEKTNISFLGIWGTSFIELDDRDLDSADAPPTGQYIKTGSDLTLGGINVSHRVNENLFLKTGLSVIDNQIKTQIDTFNYISDASKRVFNDNSGETKYSYFAQADYRKGKNLIRTGFRWDTYQINYNTSSVNQFGFFDTLQKNTSQLNLARFYFEDEYRISDRFRARVGLHSQYLLLNNSFALEPRLALRYLLSDYHVFAFSYGNHHMMQPRTIYFVETPTPTGSELTNKNLDFSAAHHFNLGYNYSINENLRLKAETYYQHLYKIPIENDPTSTFSMVNVGADFFIPQNDSLTNQGIGRNYGVEFTLEKFLDKGYYYMVNGALYKSEYQTLEKKWRSTAFDMRYTVNGLVGYEKWFLQKLAIGADLKVTYAGGRPYVPVNESESVLQGDVVFQEDRAYEVRYNDYFRTDLKIYYRINYKAAYTEFAVDFQNLTNHKNIFQKEFSPKTGTYQTYYQMAFFPMFTFKVLF